MGDKTHDYYEIKEGKPFGKKWIGITFWKRRDLNGAISFR